MKNPFPFFRTPGTKGIVPPQPDPVPKPFIHQTTSPQKPKEQPEDSFTEWCRSQVRGGIERRERNDIFEAYSVYGADDGKLVCRYYHRYPEHERDFDLSYSRVLGFDDFNRRLLSELDKDSIKLSAYRDCIQKAQELSGEPSANDTLNDSFTDTETTALRDFCEAMDTLTDKEYRIGSGVFSCSCRSVVGDDALTLRFRKPLTYDALYTEIAGVSRRPTEGYDIDNLWIMGVYNRLREQCAACRVTLLTSDWGLSQEPVWLMEADGFPSIEGTLLLAVADASAFSRFGFYSLDFSGKSV